MDAGSARAEEEKEDMDDDVDVDGRVEVDIAAPSDELAAPALGPAPANVCAGFSTTADDDDDGDDEAAGAATVLSPPSAFDEVAGMAVDTEESGEG